MSSTLEDWTDLGSNAVEFDDPASRSSDTASGPAEDQGLAENRELARLFDETAGLLEAQGANAFRVAAYRKAAEELRGLQTSVRQVVEHEGREGLVRLPRIGESLSRSIETWLRTGTLGILLRLRGEEAEERELMSIPGLGRELAHRIHHDLHISSLEELEEAAHDGRLATLPGFGQRRVQSIRDQLDARLRRRARRQSDERAHAGDPSRSRLPPIEELLDVDREYRRLAGEERLPRIRPRRFNPSGEAWLPILHTTRGRRHYTALFSNTARAHQLQRTRDWVVIYFDDRFEGQWTVVTERQGELSGRRVVRGREPECLAFYRDR